MRSAPDILKARFIEYLIDAANFPNEDDFCIGQEVMYGTNKSFADLVVLSQDKLYAFEIKSQKDNFKRLEEQLLNYKKNFDFVYLVITKNHVKHLNKVNLDKVGIFVIDDDIIFEEKKAKELKEFSKADILETIPALYLKRYFLLKSNANADDLRRSLLETSMEKLKPLLVDYMKNKLQYRYKNFMAEKGACIHYEDVSILSIANYSIF